MAGDVPGSVLTAGLLAEHAVSTAAINSAVLCLATGGPLSTSPSDLPPAHPNNHRSHGDASRPRLSPVCE